MELLGVRCWNGEGRYSWSLVMVLLALLLQLQVLFLVPDVVDAAAPGLWRVVTKNSGISAMHAAVTPVEGSVVLLQQTNQGPSNITFPDGRCRVTTYDVILKKDCYAHSVILNASTGEVRPLMVMTDTQCSSGQFLADGTLGQTGGDKEGKTKTRTLARSCYTVAPTTNQCGWEEASASLNVERWYSTNQLLPDGRQIIIGGRNTKTYEYAPPSKKTGVIPLALLDNGNFYPFVHLLPSGSLFVFVNRMSILYDYNRETVLRTFDPIPGNPRTYPNGGSSVMLPLTWKTGFQKVEILVCGGAVSPTGKGNTCSVTCGRIDASKARSTWAMESMPFPRCMGDMVLLPDTNVLIINGAQRGMQGWVSASVPTKSPVLYEPSKKSGQRFSVLASTTTPRVYHSTANLITDGSVLVAGSNTHQYYDFNPVKSDRADIPTELSVEAFTPPYAQNVPGGRPVIVSPTVSRTGSPTVTYNQSINIVFWDFPTPPPATDTFLFTLASSPWSTHSFSHGQRVVTLNPLNVTTMPGGRIENGVAVNLRTATVQIPQYDTVLPATYYMLWVVKNGNPSKSCIWVQIR